LRETFVEGMTPWVVSSRLRCAQVLDGAQARDIHDRLADRAENFVSRLETGECDEIGLLPACPAPLTRE
jgi:hypothetical protein